MGRNIITICLILILCLAVILTDVAGATPALGGDFLPAYEGPGQPGSLSPLRILGQMILSLVLVLILFYVTARFFRSKWGGFTPARHLEIVERLSLGVNKDVYLIRLGQQFLVLGVTGGSVTLLREVTAPDLLRVLQEETTAPKDFAEILTGEREGGFLSLAALEAKLAKWRGRKQSLGRYGGKEFVE